MISVMPGGASSNIDPRSDKELRPPRPIEHEPLDQVMELVGKDSPLQHFRVTLLNHTGTALDAPRNYTLDCRALSPTVSAVAVTPERDGIFLQLQTFPILEIRAHVLESDPLPESGKFFALPDLDKCGEPGAAIGHEFFPSVGGSTEFSSLKHCTLHKCPNDATTKISAFSFQEVIDGFFAGSVRDLRAVLATFRLARASQIPLQWPKAIPFENNHSDYQGLIPRLSLQQALQWIVSTPEPDRVAQVAVSASESGQSPFLRAFALEENGQQHIASVRRGVDAVDVVAACVIEGHHYLVVKREIRPALAAARIAAGDESCILPATSIGGVAESLEGETTLEAVGQRAVQGVREEAGCECQGKPHYLGMSYPSPKFGVERVYLFATEVDPYTPSGLTPELDEVVDLALIDAEDVLRLSDMGLVHDPRLEISAHILSLLGN